METVPILSDGPLEALRKTVHSERDLIMDLERDVRIIKQENKRVHLRFDPALISTPALIGRLTARYPVRDLFVENPPIEEIIAQLYRQRAIE